jgi:hypothetical protein
MKSEDIDNFFKEMVCPMCGGKGIIKKPIPPEPPIDEAC